MAVYVSNIENKREEIPLETEVEQVSHCLIHFVGCWLSN